LNDDPEEANRQGKHAAFQQVDKSERRLIHRLRQAGKSNGSLTQTLGPGAGEKKTEAGGQRTEA